METDADQSFQRTLMAIARRAPWIVACVIVAAVAAYGLSKLQTKTYTASAAVLFNPNQPAAELAGLPVTFQSGSQSSIQDTNVLLLRLGDTASKTAAAI